MWYYKTKLGTFWILDKSSSEYLLGFGDDPLKVYQTPVDAMEDVKLQQTGCIEWDISNRMKIPKDLRDWVLGQPDGWN